MGVTYSFSEGRHELFRRPGVDGGRGSRRTTGIFAKWVGREEASPSGQKCDCLIPRFGQSQTCSVLLAPRGAWAGLPAQGQAWWGLPVPPCCPWEQQEVWALCGLCSSQAGHCGSSLSGLQLPMKVRLRAISLFPSFFAVSLCLFQPCSMACGIFVPRPGTEPAPPALKSWVLTPGPPGNSLLAFLFYNLDLW